MGCVEQARLERVSAAPRSSERGAPPSLRRRTGSPKRRKPRRQQRPLVGAIVCLTLAVAAVAVVLLVPFVLTVYRSLFSDDVKPKFVGFQQYHQIFQDPILLHSLTNTLLWVGGSLILPITVGLGMAVATNGLSWGRFARFAIILPFALSGTAVAVAGAFMFQTNGAVNSAFQGLGLQSWQQPWLLQWPLNTICAIALCAWQSAGISVVLFMLGLQAIPSETIEAAALDGADGWRRFRYIIVPQLRPVTIVVVGITLANALRAFDITWVLTAGGPARSSETLALAMYRETFLLLHPGQGAALAVVLTVIVVASSWIYLRKQEV